MKKLSLVAVLAILMLVMISACTPKKSEVKVIDNNNETKVMQQVVEGITAKPDTLDPAICNFTNEMNLDAQMFEGLYRPTANGKVELGTAESVSKSPDNLTYTFKIRKDAKWSDGKPVTAYDFEYAWKRVLNPKFTTDVDYMLYFIKNAEKYKKGESKEVGIKAVDEKTLEVKLENVAPFFEQILTFHAYYPVRKDIVESNPEDWSTNPATLIGNGPFMISKYERGTDVPYIEVVRNNTYWDSKNVKLDKVITKVIDGEEAQWANYISGNIDIGMLIPKDKDINKMIKDGEIVSAPSLITEYYAINISKKPYNDIRVRKAIDLVIDRQKIVEQDKEGAFPATAFVPHGMPETNNGGDFRTSGGDYLNPTTVAKNITEARKLLAQAGYPDGKNFPPIKLLINNTTRTNIIAEIFKQNIKKALNIDVNIVNLETALFKEERNDKNFDICRMSWVADFADASNFLEVFKSDNSNNKIQWSNKEYDNLLREAAASLDEKVRMEKLHKAEKILIDESPIMPIYFDSNLYYAKSYVKNYAKSAMADTNFREVYVEKK